MNAGDKITAKETITNKNCGLKHRTSTGYIQLIDSGIVSFYMDKDPGGGRGYVEAQCSQEVFAMNFMPAPNGLNNFSYKKIAHNRKKYPQDFLHTS